MDIIKDFLLQLALIASLIFTFQIFVAQRSEKSNQVKIILIVLMGISILLCMSFPAYINSNVHLDIRIVPLLLGTLYGGWRSGIILSIVIILYRYYIGVDVGFYTTVLTLVFSLPVILLVQKQFTTAQKRKRLLITPILSTYYCLVGVVVVSSIKGFSLKDLNVHFIHFIITALAALFFIALKETITEMLRKNQQLQSAAKDAEIAFLRSQIKPHFLYNALNSIAELCIVEPEKAEELTLNLSQYLRSSFDFKELDSQTTIGNELELVEAYISIEKARFGSRLQVEYDVNADLNIEIPVLILQPLVENAIRHGLMPNLRGGTVKISVKEETDDSVSFTIEDNGRGMSEAKRETIRNSASVSKGVGLWNIRQRLQLIYGRSLHIESVEGIGTKVVFTIPSWPNKQNGG